LNFFTNYSSLTVFQNSLPVLKIYGTRNINYRFLTLVVNFEYIAFIEFNQQSRLWINVSRLKILINFAQIYIYMCVFNLILIAIYVAIYVLYVSVVITYTYVSSIDVLSLEFSTIYMFIYTSQNSIVLFNYIIHKNIVVTNEQAF